MIRDENAALKLSFSTLPCQGWSIEKIIAYCKQYGFAGVELREGKDAIVSVTMKEEKLEEISRQFREADIEVTDIASGICVKGSSEEEIQSALLSLKGAAFLAHHLCAKGIRIFLGNFARRYDDYKETLSYDKIISFIKEVCDYVDQYGIEIWVETHNEFATGKCLRKLLEDVNRDNCKIIWDILHPLEDGEEPEETLKCLGKHCVHVHIKDGIPPQDPLQHDWRYTFIGDGDVPVKRIVELLFRQGYEGYFSLEWETAWREELQVPGAKAEEVLPSYAEYMRNNGQ